MPVYDTRPSHPDVLNWNLHIQARAVELDVVDGPFLLSLAQACARHETVGAPDEQLRAKSETWRVVQVKPIEATVDYVLYRVYMMAEP